MDERDEQALKAVKLYYEAGLSQAEVAAEIGVSRPTAARLLAHAKDRGFVTIEIHDPREQGGEISTQLLEKFGQYGLTDARVVATARSDQEQLLKELGRAGAEVLEERVKDGDLLGVSWGTTMFAVARALTPTSRRGVEIVQLKGGMSYTESSTNDIETINLFCRAFDAYARTLPLPVIFDNAETKRVVEKDRHIKQLLELGAHTDIVIFTVGHTHVDALTMSLGYLSEEEREQLSRVAVGDACSRFYTLDGQIALPSVDERTVGISLDALASRPTRILVAGGRWKAEAIEVALRMGLATHLVIDRETAQDIVD